MTPLEREEIDAIIRACRRSRERREAWQVRIAVALVVCALAALAVVVVLLSAYCWSDAGAHDVRCAGAFTESGR